MCALASVGRRNDTVSATPRKRCWRQGRTVLICSTQSCWPAMNRAEEAADKRLRNQRQVVGRSMRCCDRTARCCVGGVLWLCAVWFLDFAIVPGVWGGEGKVCRMAAKDKVSQRTATRNRGARKSAPPRDNRLRPQQASRPPDLRHHSGDTMRTSQAGVPVCDTHLSPGEKTEARQPPRQVAKGRSQVVQGGRCGVRGSQCDCLTNNLHLTCSFDSCCGRAE